MKRAVFLTALCLAAVTAALAGDTVIEEIVARVNNSIITRGELRRSRETLLNELRQQDPNNAQKELAAREKDLLRDLIDQQLLVQKGQELGISADTELIKRLDTIRKQMNLENMEDLEKAAQQQGVSYEDFKQNLRNNIITQQVISREVGSRLQITADEARKYYEEHKQELERPEQVKLSEILVSTQAPENSGDKAPAEDPQRVAPAEQKANELLAQIRAGTSFEEVAKKNSDGPTAAQGGDLGYFKRGTLAKQLEDKAFSMKAGELTDVIRTKQGFVILKVTDHPEAGLPPLKQVEPQIQEAVYMQKLNPALRDYLTKLREEAFIDIKPGFVDSAASPNQTKPVTTTASVDGAKEKLKRKKRFLVF
jgi:peptidyl-prolyl cis-trans isomerase SurA